MLMGFISVNRIRSFLVKWITIIKINIIEVLNSLQTMGENKKDLSERQYKILLVERNIYHMVGAENLRKMKMVIRQNIVQNFPVTVEDIKISEKIFGTGVSTLKLRTTIQRPKLVVGYFIKIPIEMIENNQELILCMDIMFIDQQEFFTKIDKDIRFIVLVPLFNRTK